jgi:hypothetical protein
LPYEEAASGDCSGVIREHLSTLGVREGGQKAIARARSLYNRMLHLLGVLCAALTSVSARAQVYGTGNPALTQSTVDAAALGNSGKGFLELSRSGGIHWLAAAGVALGSGTLRANYTRGYFQGGILGVGYSGLITHQSLGKFGTLGAGLDLSAAYVLPSHARNYPLSYNPRALRLDLPLSIRWGSSSGVSLAPYVAPYGEIGRAVLMHGNCADFTCTGPIFYSVDQTRAAGAAVGAELTLWRLGLEIGSRDLMYHQRAIPFYQASQLTLGARIRF